MGAVALGLAAKAQVVLANNGKEIAPAARIADT